MTSVYRIYDVDGNILYVGQSIRAAGRLSEHSAKPWWLTAARVEIEHFDGKDEATLREIELIRELDPPHNITHKPVEWVAVSTTVSKDLLEWVDGQAEEWGLSRSATVARILKESVENDLRAVAV